MRPTGRGFTLVELLVVMAILVVLIGLLLSAVQVSRGASRRVQCHNNLRQLAVATQHFHERHQMMPTYWGYFPIAGTHRLQGSWVVHLLPDLEQRAAHDQMRSAAGKLVQQEKVLVAEASPDYRPGYWDDNGGRWETISTEVIVTESDHVGHTWTQKKTVTEKVWVGPPRIWVPQVGTPPVYEQRGGFIGVEAWADLSLPVLQCTDDPSETGPGAKVRWKYDKPWSLTNYQANLHAMVPLKRDSKGRFSFQSYSFQTPLRFVQIRDGLTQTMLYAEGMRECDGTYRFAFWSDYQFRHSHNFGITWQKVANTFMFQSQPGRSGCNNWRVQGNHGRFLSAAWCDGSVRTVSADVTRREVTDPNLHGTQVGVDAVMGTVDGVWDLLLMPNDGRPIQGTY